jgi:hypothetical protein
MHHHQLHKKHSYDHKLLHKYLIFIYIQELSHIIIKYQNKITYYELK